MDPVLTLWFATWLRRVDDEQHAWLEDVLGTNWSREYFNNLDRGGTGVRPNNVRVPLTLALAQNDFLKEVKKMLGTTTSDMPGGTPAELQGSEVVELGNLKKDDFLAIIGGAGLLPQHIDPTKAR